MQNTVSAKRLEQMANWQHTVVRNHTAPKIINVAQLYACGHQPTKCLNPTINTNPM